MNTIKFRWLCGVWLAALLLAPRALQAHWHISDIAPAGVPGQFNIEAPLSGGYTGSDLSFGRLPGSWLTAPDDLLSVSRPTPLVTPSDGLLVPSEPHPQVVPEPGAFALALVTILLARRRLISQAAFIVR